MKELLEKIFFGETVYEDLIKGVYAHQYPEEEVGGVRKQIREQYRKRWPQPNLDPSPLINPWLYDPCDPPDGWIYDPYYELWIKCNE